MEDLKADINVAIDAEKVRADKQFGEMFTDEYALLMLEEEYRELGLEYGIIKDNIKYLENNMNALDREEINRIIKELHKRAVLAACEASQIAVVCDRWLNKNESQVLSLIRLCDTHARVKDYDFSNSPYLESVLMTNDVLFIDAYCFKDCVKLEYVEMSKNLMRIGQNAFENCKSLSEIDIPEGVLDIGADAFRGCESLSNVAIPKSVGRIGDRAFLNCGNLYIYGYKDSVAEKHAKKYGINFKVIK